jgi:hypothetical protein
MTRVERAATRLRAAAAWRRGDEWRRGERRGASGAGASGASGQVLLGISPDNDNAKSNTNGIAGW